VFVDLEPVQRSEDECDKRRFKSFNHSTCKTVRKRDFRGSLLNVVIMRSSDKVQTQLQLWMAFLV